MAEVPAPACGGLVKIDERGGNAQRPEHQDPEGGELDPGMHPDRSGGGAGHRAEQGEPDAIACDLDGEGLGRRAGDGQVGKDDVGEFRDLPDVDLEQVPTESPGPADPLGEDVRRCGHVLSGETGECCTQRERRREEPPDDSSKAHADAESHEDDDDHRDLLLPSGPDRPGAASECVMSERGGRSRCF